MKFCFSLLALLVLGVSQSQAAFVLSVDPANLVFTGPGAHNVNVRATHNGVGLSTLSGYTIRFGSPADASQGVLPTGVIATGATEVLPVSTNSLFNFNTTTNTVAASSLAGDQNIGTGGTATLFRLALNLGNASSYTIGVDLQNAQRGGLFASEIGTEFIPNNPTTDFTFTLIAVPEPTCISLMACAFGVSLLSRRRR